MLELLEKKKPVVLKAFAFRCQWITKDGNPDGYSYAVDKSKLAVEIFRREKICKDKAIEIKPVQVDVKFTKFIEAQRGMTYSTVSEKHKQDLSRD